MLILPYCFSLQTAAICGTALAVRSQVNVVVMCKHFLFCFEGLWVPTCIVFPPAWLLWFLPPVSYCLSSLVYESHVIFFVFVGSSALILCFHALCFLACSWSIHPAAYSLVCSVFSPVVLVFGVCPYSFRVTKALEWLKLAFCSVLFFWPFCLHLGPTKFITCVWADYTNDNQVFLLTTSESN